MEYTYDELFKTNSTHKQLYLEFSGGETVTNSDIYSESMTIEESLCSEDEISFGACEASSFKIKIANSFVSHIGQTVDVSLVFDDYTDEKYPLGTYKVQSDKPAADRRYREITAYDAMYDIINTDVAEWYDSILPDSGSTVTLKQFRDSFLAYFGIEQEEVTLVNDGMTVERTIDPSELSGKDVINAICELNGCFGHIGRDGVFRYVFPSEDAVKIENAYYKSCEYEDYETQTVTRLQVRQEEDDIGAVVGDDDTNTYVVQDNFLVYGKGTDELTGIAENLFSKIQNFYYRPATINAVGNPELNVGDSIYLDTTYATVRTYILKRTLTGIQALNDEYEADGDEYLSGDVNSIQSSITQLKGKANVLSRTIEETKSQITDVENGLQSKIDQTSDSILEQVSKNYVTVEYVEKAISELEGEIGNGVSNITYYFSLSDNGEEPVCEPGADLVAPIVDEFTVDEAIVDAESWTDIWTTERLEANEDTYLWICAFVEYEDDTSKWTECICLTDKTAVEAVNKLEERYAEINITLEEISIDMGARFEEIAEDYTKTTEMNAVIAEQISDSEVKILNEISGTYATQTDLTKTESALSAKIDSSVSESEASIRSDLDANYATKDELSSSESTLTSYIDQTVTETEAEIMQKVSDDYVTKDSLEEVTGSISAEIDTKISTSEASISSTIESAKEELTAGIESATEEMSNKIEQTVTDTENSILMQVADTYATNDSVNSSLNALAEQIGDAVTNVTYYFSLSDNGEEPVCEPGADLVAPIVDEFTVDEAIVDAESWTDIWTTERPEVDEDTYLWVAAFVEYEDESTKWTSCFCLTDSVAREKIEERYSEINLALDSITATVYAKFEDYFTTEEVKAEIALQVEQGEASITSKISEEYETKVDANMKAAYYGTCDTAAATGTKVIVCDAFTSDSLVRGATISVTFTHENTAYPVYFSFDGISGTKEVYAYGKSFAADSPYNWTDGATVIFVYDGTYWNLADSGSFDLVVSKTNEINQTVTDAENSIELLAKNVSDNYYTKDEVSTEISSSITDAETSINSKISSMEQEMDEKFAKATYYGTCSKHSYKTVQTYSYTGTCADDSSTLYLTVDSSIHSSAVASGVTIAVTFTNAQNFTLKWLNFNGYGNIQVKNGTNCECNAGDTVLFEYDGSYWNYIMNLSTDVISVTYEIVDCDSFTEDALVSGTTIAITFDNEPDFNIGTDFTGTCDTQWSGTVITGTVDCDNFTADDLTSGTSIAVTFTYGLVYHHAMININGTGAKYVYSTDNTNAINSGDYWSAGDTVILTYDGTYWRIGGTAELTLYLNINDTGVVQAYAYNSAVWDESYAWTAGSTVLFAYDGEKWMYADSGVMYTVTEKTNEITQLVSDTENSITAKVEEQISDLNKTVSASLVLAIDEDSNGNKFGYVSANADYISLTSGEIVINAGNLKINQDGTATIGGFTIGSSSIYKTKSSLYDTNSGIYIGTNGIAIGGDSSTSSTSSYFRATSSGAVTATGSFTATNGTYKTVVTSGRIRFYSGDDLFGMIYPGVWDNKYDGFSLRTITDYLALTYASSESATGSVVLAVNKNGNLSGYSEPLLLYGSKRLSGYTYIGSTSAYFNGGTLSDQDAMFLYGCLVTENNVKINGDFSVTGTKNRAVETEHYGTVLTNAFETASAHFADIGSAEISADGQVTVYFDPEFAETIDLDSEYQVLVTKTSDGDIDYVDKQPGYFTVYGSAGTTLDWMVIGYQKDYTINRLECADTEDGEEDKGDVMI